MAKHAAEQKAQELAAQVEKLAEQAVETATEAQHTLEAASQKAARDAEKAEVGCLASLTTTSSRVRDDQ